MNIDRKHNATSTMFLAVEKQGNIDRKHDLTSTMFLALEKQGNIDRKHIILHQQCFLKWTDKETSMETCFSNNVS